MTITSYTPQSTLMVVYTAPNGIYTDTYNGAVYLNTKSKILTGTLANLTWSGGTDISSQVGGIDPRTNVGPACCNFKGRLYVVYKAWDGPDLYMSYRDVSWHGDKSIHGNYGYITARTDSPPCLIEYDHTLYLFYKGDGTNEIRQATLNIDQWNGNQAVKIVNNASVPETDCSPTAGLFNRKLYLAYKGIGSSNKIYISIFDGSSWVGDRTIAFFGGTIDPETDCAPALGSYNGWLYLAYKGVGTSKIYISWFDGAWHGDKSIHELSGGTISPETDSQPALINYGSYLLLVYVGKGTNNIYYARMDWTMRWSGDCAINAAAGGNAPQSSFAPALTFATPTLDTSTWLGSIADSTAIGNINIPGTHDSASINGWLVTPYACHYQSITDQLKAGIRLLDVRLKVNGTSSNYSFSTPGFPR